MQFWSDYIIQSATLSSFGKSAITSFVILSDIEKRIKEKIEQVGIPLKDWNINIYRGILTGYNEAFIIDGKTKDRLIEKSPKNAEIIRPILRGRDIKRYGYEFADLWLICTFPSLKIDIEEYPAIKEHLLSYGYDRLKQTGDIGARKKTNNQWFETQDSISYWDDFSKRKIIYPEITKFINFYCDNEHFVTNNKCFILTGEHIEFLTAFLNSSLFKYCFLDNFPELLGGTRELRKIFLEKIPVRQIDSNTNKLFSDKVSELQRKASCFTQTKNLEMEIDNMIFDLYQLTEEERKIIGFIEIQ